MPCSGAVNAYGGAVNAYGGAVNAYGGAVNAYGGMAAPDAGEPLRRVREAVSGEAQASCEVHVTFTPFAKRPPIRPQGVH